MDKQNVNQTLGSTTSVPEHPGPIDGGHTKSEDAESSRENSEAAEGQLAQRLAAAARSEGKNDEDGDEDDVEGDASLANARDWRGQAVARAPVGRAERAATRAENPLPKRRGDEDDLPPAARRPPVPMSPEDATQAQELKRQSAAEDHEDARAEGRHTVPKSL